jgi:acyl carrier protein
MTHEETIRKKVYEILEDQLGISQTDIKDDSKIVEDLGADSLDLVELVMTLDEEFNTDITDEEADKLFTVRNIIDYLRDNTTP